MPTARQDELSSLAQESRERLLSLTPRAVDIIEKNLGVLDVETNLEEAWHVLEVTGVASKQAPVQAQVQDLSPGVVSAIRAAFSGLAEGLGVHISPAQDQAPAPRPVLPDLLEQAPAPAAPPAEVPVQKPVLGRRRAKPKEEGPS